MTPYSPYPPQCMPSPPGVASRTSPDVGSRDGFLVVLNQMPPKRHVQPQDLKDFPEVQRMAEPARSGEAMYSIYKSMDRSLLMERIREASGVDSACSRRPEIPSSCDMLPAGQQSGFVAASRNPHFEVAEVGGRGGWGAEHARKGKRENARISAMQSDAPRGKISLCSKEFEYALRQKPARSTEGRPGGSSSRAGRSGPSDDAQAGKPREPSSLPAAGVVSCKNPDPNHEPMFPGRQRGQGRHNSASASIQHWTPMGRYRGID